MYDEFSIANFRGITSLHLQNLARINLIGGANQSGKTSLLEAIFLHCGGNLPRLAITVNALRDVSQTVVLGERPIWESLFSFLDTKTRITLDGHSELGHHSLTLRSLQSEQELAKLPLYLRGTQVPSTARSEPTQALELRFRRLGAKRDSVGYVYQEPGGLRAEPLNGKPLFPAFLVATHSGSIAQEIEMFGRLRVRGKHQPVLAILQLLEPRLVSLETVMTGQQPEMYADLGASPLLPLKTMGAGIVRLFVIAVSLAECPGGVLLLDEIENGIHYSVHRRLLGALAQAARDTNVQLFITTHSHEVITAVSEELRVGPDDYAYVRLDRQGDTTTAAYFDPETLAASLDAGLEVR